TAIIAQHLEDLKDGRAFAEVARRVSKKKPIVVLKAGRTAMGARAASSHTGALAGNDKIYEDVLKQSGVIRARSLRDLLEFARAIPVLPAPKGENVIIITGAGGSGVLLSDAVVDNNLSLMAMPPDLDAAFRKFIPPFGAAGNPVDITGAEPPKTYQNTVKLGLEEPRIHALILGYWHTIITPPMVFAKLVVEIVEEMKGKGIHKPVVASLAGDVQVEEASEYLYDHGIPAYPYSTEIPVARDVRHRALHPPGRLLGQCRSLRRLGAELASPPARRRPSRRVDRQAALPVERGRQRLQRRDRADACHRRHRRSDGAGARDP